MRVFIERFKKIKVYVPENKLKTYKLKTYKHSFGQKTLGVNFKFCSNNPRLFDFTGLIFTREWFIGQFYKLKFLDGL